jgi:hypothetical protein
MCGFRCGGESEWLDAMSEEAEVREGEVVARQM